MKVSQDYKGKYITSVTLRRCDTNTGSGKPVAQLEQVYLYANCMNSNEEVIDRFYSFDKHQQTQDDGLQTTWHFEEPIKISKDYEFIRFYCTRVIGEAQTDVNLRSSNIKIGDNRQYINGWKTVDQASTKEFTTDFCVNVYQRITGILDHVNDTIIHVTSVDKERWDNKIDLETLNQNMIKTASSITNDANTVPTTQAVFLEMGYILTDAQSYTDGQITTHKNNTNLHPSISSQAKWNSHVNNNDIHVTAADKEKWNNIVIPEIPEPVTYTAGDGIEITDNTISVITTDVIEESDKIPTAKALYNTFYGTRTFNNYDSSKYTHLPDTVGTIVLSKKHFIKNCKITKFALPHDKNIDNGEGGHLVIEVFAEDLSKSDGYDKANPIHRYYSDNYYAYKMNVQNGKYEWTFNNIECLIPSDYKVVHLSLVTDNTIVPSIGSANNNKLRINCLAKNNNKGEGTVYEEDDECRVYWKANNNPNVGGDNFVAIAQVEYIGNKLDDFSIVPMLLERIAALEARVSELENS